MGARKLSKAELAAYVDSLPDDEPDDDDGVSVHVIKVKTDDPKWSWLFGAGDSGGTEEEAEEETEEETEEEEKPKKDPKPKSRNRYFGA